MKKVLFSFFSLSVLGIVAILFLLRQNSNTTTTIPSRPRPTIQISAPAKFTISTLVQPGGLVRDLEITPAGTLLFSRVDTNTISAVLPKNQIKVIISGGNLLHGIAFHKGKIFVAEKEKVSRYGWDEDTKTATFERDIITLPSGSLHTYRTLLFDEKGSLYISIGADCNVCDVAIPWEGTILVTDENGFQPKVFARGLRNAPFMANNPETGDIWATEMGRDYLGDDLPPDEINIISQNGDYGFPTCYGSKIHDTNFDMKQYIQDPCKNTIAPIYDIPAHSAPLGLAFVPESFNPDWKGDLLVAYHGSWNRSTKTGYKIVHMKVSGKTITSSEDFMTGFFDGNRVESRPVDLVFDTSGTLYISDDKSGNIFSVKRVN